MHNSRTAVLNSFWSRHTVQKEKSFFTPFDVLFFVLSEKFAPQEVPSHTPWGVWAPPIENCCSTIKRLTLILHW